jgi:hypothetical protein
MKKIVVLAMVLLVTQVAFSQINKGAILLEGSANFNQITAEDEFAVNYTIDTYDYKSTFFAFNPKVGFFTSETLLVGIGLNYEHNGYSYKSSYDGSTYSTRKEKSNLYFINPYIKKFIPIKDKLFLTLTANALVGLGKVNYEIKDEFAGEGKIKNDQFAFRVNASPGIAYFFNNQWAITASFGQLFYTYKKEELNADLGLSEKPKNVDTTYGLSFQFNTFGIGVQYVLRNKAE